MRDVTSTPEHASTIDTTNTGTSRRRMLRLALAGAAAGGAATIASGVRQVAAADGDSVVAGQTVEHNITTSVNFKGAKVASSFNIQSGDETAANDGILNGLFASAGTALLGVASGNGNQGIGITGWSKKPGGTGAAGEPDDAGAYGGEFFGGLAEVRLRPGGAAPITLTNAHKEGELYEDETNTLWICVTGGTPGTWREIAGTTTAGAFHAIAPRRVWDSRTGAKLAPTVDRVVSVANATDGTLDVVPAKATAVSLTVTVTETEGTGGFVAVRPQGAPYAGTASVNWFGPNQNLAATAITALGGDREIIVRAGAAYTHLVIDVTGYYR